MPFISTTREVPATRRRVWRRIVVCGLLVLWAVTAYWETHKPLPQSTRVESSWYAAAPHDVAFIADITSADAYGRPVVSQAIFDEVLAAVRAARQYVVLDYYLFGGSGSALADSAPRRISQE